MTPGPAAAAAADEQSVCRICLRGRAEQGPLVAPCGCRGSLAFVHSQCLAAWTRRADRSVCDLCRRPYRRRVRGRLPRQEWPSAFRRRFRLLSETEDAAKVWRPFLVMVAVSAVLYLLAGLAVHRFETDISRAIRLFYAARSLPRAALHLCCLAVSLCLGVLFHLLTLASAALVDFLLSDATVDYEYVSVVDAG